MTNHLLNPTIMEETRKLGVQVPSRTVDRMRQLLQPEESMGDLLRRIINDRLEMEAANANTAS